MAPLGPPGPGPRHDQGELRRRGRASRAGRHQLRRESDGTRPRPGGPGPGRARQGRRPKRDAAKDAAKQGRGREAQDDRLRRHAQAASRSGSIPTGPTSTRWPTTPSSIRSSSACTSSARSGSSTTARRRPRPPATPAGSRGKGGDLLYRWGNPRAYRAGTKADQTLFVQHNAHWIPRGFPGAGHLLVFNNGGDRPDGTIRRLTSSSSPVDAQGRYTREPGKAFGPGQAVWSYSAPKKSDFYSSFISGAQRLPNGNTLICSGPTARSSR